MANIIERENLLSQIVEGAEKTIDGNGLIMQVFGEAGIGKTSLLEAAREQLVGKFDVIWTGCEPLFTPKPLGPLFDIRHPIGNLIKPLLVKETSFSQVFSTLFESIESSNTPIILIMEDVHWADFATIDLLKYLAKRVYFLPCLLLISFRSDEIDESHPLTSALDVMPPAHTLRLSVPPLSEDGVRSLAILANRQEEGLHEITHGNPFFVSELLASGQPSDKNIPKSIQDAVNARLNRLVKEERHFLETASLVPNGISTQLVTYLFSDHGDTLAMACVARGLLSIDAQGNYRFRHELARLSTLARVSPKQQQKIHAEIVSALEDMTSVPNLGSLVHHASGAMDAKRVLRYAKEEAHNATKLGAHKEAASYLATALRFVDEADTETAALLYECWAYEAGIAQSVDNDVIEARRYSITLWRALKRMDKVGENLYWLSRLHWYRGEAVEANHFANEAINVLEDCPPSAQRAMAYSLRSQLDMLNDRSEESIRWGEKALELEKKFPSIEVRIHALNNTGSAYSMLGKSIGKERLLESLNLALEHGLHEHAARAYTNLSDFSLRDNDLEFAEQIINQGIAFDTKHELDSWTYYLVGIQAHLRLAQGRLNDAESISLGVMKLDKLTTLMKLPALLVLAKAQMRMAKSTYREHLQAALTSALEVDEIQYIIPARLTAIESAWLDADHATAMNHLNAILDLGSGALNPERAGKVRLWIKRLNTDFSCPFDAALPEPYRLELDNNYMAAADAWLELGLPYNAALSLLHEESELSVEAYLKALKIVERVGAKNLESVIKSKADKLGISQLLPKAKRGPYKSSRQHPAGLTKKEQQVLRHILSGESNKEIANLLSRSQRTIENHVSSILGKLSVNSRLDAILRIQNEPWLGPM